MKSKFTALCLCFAVLLALSGCGDEAQEETKATLVKTETVTLGDGTESGTYPGTIKGRYETNMAFQVGGRIIQRYVQAGDTVHAGDVLMSIDQRDVQQVANQGEAQVAAAKAQLELSRTNLSRYSALYAQDAISASTLDQYQTAYDAALASYNQAVAAATQGYNSLGYASLVASADGVISAVQAEAGQVVSAGQTVLTLVQPQELEAEINLPENRIDGISIGKNVSVSFWSLNQESVTGVVREISPMADSTARTYRVRISLPNPPAGLKLGMTASVTIDGLHIGHSAPAAAAADSSFAILPISAIYQTDSNPHVWVVNPDDMTLSLQQVEVADFTQDKLKVKGLKSGDIVVTAGVHKLREGTKVRLAEAEK